MHYAHRSSFYLCSSSGIVHCLQEHIQVKSHVHRPDSSHRGFIDTQRQTAKQSSSQKPIHKLPTAVPYRANAIAAIPHAQIRAKIDATVIHTREIASMGIDSSRKAPQKWEHMVMRMQALEAKFGGDFELRASNCWRNLEAIREKKGPGISPEALSLAVFLQPFQKLVFCGKLDAPPVVRPENRGALRDLNFHVLSSFRGYNTISGPACQALFSKNPRLPALTRKRVCCSFGSEWAVLAFWLCPLYPYTISHKKRAVAFIVAFIAVYSSPGHIFFHFFAAPFKSSL